MSTRKLKIQCKGVIHGVVLDISEDDIVVAYKDQGVIAAKRMTKKGPGGKVTQLSLVCLTFDMVDLPLSITMGYQSYPVRAYVPDVIRCYKCQRIGHTVNNCKGPQKCVRCGGPHGFEQCTEERKCASKVRRCSLSSL